VNVSYSYRLFGLGVLSDEPIPGLVPTALAEANLHISLGRRPPAEERLRASPGVPLYTSSLSESGKPVLKITLHEAEGLTHFIYSDGMEFWWDKDHKNIWSVWPEPLTIDDAATYLLGPILGTLLRRKGSTCLHASAVNFRGSALLFAGHPGAGKSTTAAAMARRGHPVLSDDVVPIAESNGAFVAFPSYPYISLWPKSVEILFGSEKKLPVFSPVYPKTRLELGCSSHPFQESAVPLGTIFVFAKRSPDPRAPFIEELSLQEGLISLVVNSYATGILDKSLRAAEFEHFGKMMRSVRVLRLHPHSDPRLLDKLCDLIEKSSIGTPQAAQAIGLVGVGTSRVGASSSDITPPSR
jgi:hypothetical protein